MSFFGKKKTQKQVIREQKRDIGREKRTLDREIRSLELDEKRIITKIKQLSKKNDLQSARVLAKQLVQIRANKARLYKTQGSMSAAQVNITHAASNVAVAKSMGKTAQVMGAINRATPVQQQQKMMMAYERNKEQLEMKNEMMDDILEGDEELSDEADEMLESVFESIGLDVQGRLPETGGELPAMSAAEKDEMAKLLAGI